MFYASKEKKQSLVMKVLLLFGCGFSHSFLGDMSLPRDKHRWLEGSPEVTCEHFNRQDSKAALQIPGSWQADMHRLVRE